MFSLIGCVQIHKDAYVEDVCEDQDEADGHAEVSYSGESCHVSQVSDEGQDDDEWKEEDHI